MDATGLIILLIVGAVAGWLAGQLVKGYGYGLIGNIVVGIVGAVIAGFLLPRLGIAIGGGILGAIRVCQEFCARGHDDGKERIITWLSRGNCWTNC